MREPFLFFFGGGAINHFWNLCEIVLFHTSDRSDRSSKKIDPLHIYHLQIDDLQ